MASRAGSLGSRHKASGVPGDGEGEWEVYTVPETVEGRSAGSFHRGKRHRTRPVAIGREIEGGIEIVLLSEMV